MPLPYGPIRLNRNRQIAIPKALTDQLNLSEGDQLYLMQSATNPKQLTLVPESMMSDWLARGLAPEPRL